jgi:hypothetical protein
MDFDHYQEDLLKQIEKFTTETEMMANELQELSNKLLSYPFPEIVLQKLPNVEVSVDSADFSL